MGGVCLCSAEKLEGGAFVCEGVWVGTERHYIFRSSAKFKLISAFLN